MHQMWHKFDIVTISDKMKCSHPGEWKGQVGFWDLPKQLPDLSFLGIHLGASLFLERLVAEDVLSPSEIHKLQHSNKRHDDKVGRGWSIRSVHQYTMTTISEGTNIPFSIYSLARFPFSVPASISALSKSPAAICTSPYCIYQHYLIQSVSLQKQLKHVDSSFANETLKYKNCI